MRSHDTFLVSMAEHTDGRVLQQWQREASPQNKQVLGQQQELC